MSCRFWAWEPLGCLLQWFGVMVHSPLLTPSTQAHNTHMPTHHYLHQHSQKVSFFFFIRKCYGKNSLQPIRSLGGASLRQLVQPVQARGGNGQPYSSTDCACGWFYSTYSEWLGSFLNPLRVIYFVGVVVLPVKEKGECWVGSSMFEEHIEWAEL